MKYSLEKLKTPGMASLAACLSMWLLAGLWHQVIAPGFYSDDGESAHHGLGLIFLAYLVLGIMMVWIFERYHRRKNYYLDGIKVGVFVGVLWVFPHEITVAAAHGESIMDAFLNSAWHVVEQGVGGLVVGLFYYMMRP